MNHQPQIAAKAAAHSCKRMKLGTIDQMLLTADYQTAIEKAYCLGVDEMTKCGIEAVRESRALQGSEKVKLAAERLRYECETTEEPNSGFAKDILTLVEFVESRAAQASEQGADTKRLDWLERNRGNKGMLLFGLGETLRNAIDVAMHPTPSTEGEK